MKRVVARALGRLAAAAEADQLRKPARTVNRALEAARVTRAALLEVLGDSEHVAIYPGSCRFVMPPTPLV